MTEHIKQYYHTERNTALIGAAIGLAFIITAWGVYHQYGVEQFNRGLVYTLAAGGLFLRTTQKWQKFLLNRQLQNIL